MLLQYVAFLLVQMTRPNPPQREAIRYIDGPLLVLAGAGSGKTRVIIEKIAYLIQQCDYSAKRITAVTFTNKAAQEMTQRVRANLGERAKGLRISTFHALGLNIIRAELEALNLKRGFSIFDAQDSMALLQDLALQERLGDSEVISTCQHLISQWKNDLLGPEQVSQLAENGVERQAAALYAKYERSLQAYNAVDFDDLISKPVRLLQTDATVRERWQNNIHYMLVDEYQDTNTSQYQLLQLITGSRAMFTVVGDDDQSIYSWRGARPENLDILQSDYPQLKAIKLEQNYRSTQTILGAANHLIANNPHSFEKRLWSELGLGESVHVERRADENDEIEYVVNEILDHRLRHKSELQDFAVLYRSNFQARLLEMRLQAEQLPYRISGGTSFFARNEIKDLMAYLRLLINPVDDGAMLRVINTPRRGIGAQTLETLATYAQSRDTGLLAACSEMGLTSLLEGKALHKVQQFGRWMEDRQRALQHEPVAAIKQLLSDIDYEDWLLQNSSSTATAERRWANVQFLISAIEKDVKAAGDAAEIEKIIAKLVLRDLLDRQENEEDFDRIQLLTLHAAKGLEFKHVYIIGFEEELLPHRNSVEPAAIEEERRLAYVGMTRAQQTLTLSYAARRKKYGEVVACEPSRFLEELPQQFIVWPAKTALSPEQNKARGEQTMGSLKALFD